MSLPRGHFVTQALLAAVLSGACSPSSDNKRLRDNPSDVDGAGTRFQALREFDGRWCTGDHQWCVAIADTGARLTHGKRVWQIPIASDSSSTAKVWPVIIREGAADRTVMIGIAERRTSADQRAYRDVAHGRLYRVTSDQDPVQEVLRFPLLADVALECDTLDGRECNQRFQFFGALGLDESHSATPPRLTLTTMARRSTAGGEPEIDGTCTYHRELSFDGQRYRYDSPPPDCEDYLTP